MMPAQARESHFHNGIEHRNMLKDVVHYNLYHHHGHLVKEGNIPRAAMAFIWDGTGTREPRDRCTVLNRVRYTNDHDARYDLPDDGSQCGPRHPMWKPKINNGSSMVLRTAPVRVHIMEKRGLPSARIRLEPPVVRIRNGNQRDVMPV